MAKTTKRTTQKKKKGTGSRPPVAASHRNTTKKMQNALAGLASMMVGNTGAAASIRVPKSKSYNPYAKPYLTTGSRGGPRGSRRITVRAPSRRENLFARPTFNLTNPNVAAQYARMMTPAPPPVSYVPAAPVMAAAPAHLPHVPEENLLDDELLTAMGAMSVNPSRR